MRRLGDGLERIEAAKDAELILVQAEQSGSPQLFITAYDAILYYLLVIGEAVKFVGQGFREAHPKAPWTSITGMRDIPAHECFRVSADVVRQTLDQPLDRLKLACRSRVDSVSLVGYLARFCACRAGILRSRSRVPRHPRRSHGSALRRSATCALSRSRTSRATRTRASFAGAAGLSSPDLAPDFTDPQGATLAPRQQRCAQPQRVSSTLAQPG